ncbi:hypothetical protein Tco_1539528 [Tanacetum coccineum]
MQERLDLNKSQGAQTPNEVNRMKNVPYASAVGSIMYAVRCTRPDVAFAQNMTSRFQQNPELRGGMLLRCWIRGLVREDTKSLTGYVFVLNEAQWIGRCYKQSTNEMSAYRIEYIARRSCHGKLFD